MSENIFQLTLSAQHLFQFLVLIFFTFSFLLVENYSLDRRLDYRTALLWRQ